MSVAASLKNIFGKKDPSEDDPWINAVLITCGPARHALAIEPVLRPAS